MNTSKLNATDVIIHDLSPQNKILILGIDEIIFKTINEIFARLILKNNSPYLKDFTPGCMENYCVNLIDKKRDNSILKSMKDPNKKQLVICLSSTIQAKVKEIFGSAKFGFLKKISHYDCFKDLVASSSLLSRLEFANWIEKNCPDLLNETHTAAKYKNIYDEEKAFKLLGVYYKKPSKDLE